MHSYKVKNPSFEKRQAEWNKVLQKYPDKVPVLVEIRSDSKREAKLPQLDKTSFLLPQDLSCHQFQYLLRKRMKLHEKDALFLMIDSNSMSKGDQLMGDVYTKKKDKDGYLYITVTNESISG